MEIKFDREEIEALILAEAQKFDGRVNEVLIDTGYGNLRSATCYYNRPREAAPATVNVAKESSGEELEPL